MVFLKDLLFAVTPIVAEDDTFVRATWATMILLTYVLAVALARPYRARIATAFDIFLHGCMVVLIALGGALDEDTSETGKSLFAGFFYTSFLVPALFLGSLLVLGMLILCRCVDVAAFDDAVQAQSVKFWGEWSKASELETTASKILESMEAEGQSKALSRLDEAELADLVKALRRAAASARVGDRASLGLLQFATLILPQNILLPDESKPDQDAARIQPDAVHAAGVGLEDGDLAGRDGTELMQGRTEALSEYNATELPQRAGSQLAGTQNEGLPSDTVSL